MLLPLQQNLRQQIRLSWLEIEPEAAPQIRLSWLEIEPEAAPQIRLSWLEIEPGAAVEPAPNKAGGSSTRAPRVIRRRPAWVIPEAYAKPLSQDDQDAEALLLCGVL